MRAIAEEWVIKAESDYHTAYRAMGDVERDEFPIADTTCFHCQQCAEKYLKAFLEEHEIEFPRSHPLLPLLDLCRSVDPSFVDLRNDLTGLDNYAVAVRYPGVAVTLKMANAALAAMVHVRAFVRGKLGLN